MPYARYAYPIELHPDDNDTILVTCPDVPELTTFGDDETDAIANAANALVAAFDERMERGDDIPPPGDAGGRHVAHLPTRAVLKVALYSEMRRRGVSQAELSRRMGIDPRQVRRMLDLTQHGLRPDEFDRAFAAIGCVLDVGVREAA